MVNSTRRDEIVQIKLTLYKLKEYFDEIGISDNNYIGFESMEYDPFRLNAPIKEQKLATLQLAKGALLTINEENMANAIDKLILNLDTDTRDSIDFNKLIPDRYEDGADNEKINELVRELDSSDIIDIIKSRKVRGGIEKGKLAKMAYIDSGLTKRMDLAIPALEMHLRHLDAQGRLKERIDVRHLTIKDHAERLSEISPGMTPEKAAEIIYVNMGREDDKDEAIRKFKQFLRNYRFEHGEDLDFDTRTIEEHTLDILEEDSDVDDRYVARKVYLETGKEDDLDRAVEKLQSTKGRLRSKGKLPEHVSDKEIIKRMIDDGKTENEIIEEFYLEEGKAKNRQHAKRLLKAQMWEINNRNSN